MYFQQRVRGAIFFLWVAFFSRLPKQVPIGRSFSTLKALMSGQPPSGPEEFFETLQERDREVAQGANFCCQFLLLVSLKGL